jgi:hypothetical protein
MLKSAPALELIAAFDAVAVKLRPSLDFFCASEAAALTSSGEMLE